MVQLLILALLIAAVVAASVPLYLRARARYHQELCRENLSRIDGAKLKWSTGHEKDSADIPSWDDIIGDGYLEAKPLCPSGGTYSINSVARMPSCSLATEGSHPHLIPDLLNAGGGDQGAGT